MFETLAICPQVAAKHHTIRFFVYAAIRTPAGAGYGGIYGWPNPEAQLMTVVSPQLYTTRTTAALGPINGLDGTDVRTRV